MMTTRKRFPHECPAYANEKATKPVARALAGALIMLTSAQAQELELRVEPSEVVYANETARRYNMRDIMVQTIAVINRSDAPVRFRELVLEAGDEEFTLVSDRIIPETYERAWQSWYAYYSDPAVLDAQDSIHLISRVVPDGVTLSPSLTMAPDTAIIVTNRALLFSGGVIPSVLRVRAQAEDADGNRLTAKVTRRIERYQQKNDFILPLRGRWYIASSSSLRSHHRIRLGHEFALDLVKIGSHGSSFRGNGSRPKDYYAYGEDVLAVADGKVIEASDGIADTEMPKPGESRRDFAVRVLDAMWQEDPTGRVAGGNYIIIEHNGGEHSFYVHLKNSSVTAKSGDTVRQGQKIGEVGISGDGFQPHLHFAVTDSPSRSYGQGLPVFFTNVRPVAFSSTLDMAEQRLFLAGEFIETMDTDGN